MEDDEVKGVLFRSCVALGLDCGASCLVVVYRASIRCNISFRLRMLSSHSRPRRLCTCLPRSQQSLNVSDDLGQRASVQCKIKQRLYTELTSCVSTNRNFVHPSVIVQSFIMSTLATRSAIRTAARSLQRTTAPLRTSSVLSQKAFTPQQHRVRSLQPRRAFSVTANMASAAPESLKDVPREFDQEIVDMAEYIHKYKIDSDLAVRGIKIRANYTELTPATG